MTGWPGKVFKAHLKPSRTVLTSPARITASAATAGGVKGSNSKCRSLKMGRRMKLNPSVFRPLPRGRHLHQLGIELAEDSDQVALGGHDLMDVLIHHGHLIQTGGNEGHALLAQEAVGVFPVELRVRGLAAHHPARPMRGGVQRFGVAFAADDESRRGHRTGYDPQHAFAGRGRALAMHDDLAFDPTDYVPFFPGKVVMVL